MQTTCCLHSVGWCAWPVCMLPGHEYAALSAFLASYDIVTLRVCVQLIACLGTIVMLGSAQLEP